jgi:hypothetical protein
MFEDSLIESTGRIRIHARRYLAGSLLAEALLLSLFVLLPCFFPEALPRKFLSISLVTPSPPPAAPSPIGLTRAAPSSAPEMLGSTLVAPSRIQHGWHPILDAVPPGIGVPGADLGGAPGGVNPLSRLALPPSPALGFVPLDPPARFAFLKALPPVSSSRPSSRSIQPSPAPPALRVRLWCPRSSPHRAGLRPCASSADHLCSSAPPSPPSAWPVIVPGPSMASPSKSRPRSASFSPSAIPENPDGVCFLKKKKRPPKGPPLPKIHTLTTTARPRTEQAVPSASSCQGNCRRRRSHSTAACLQTTAAIQGSADDT